MVRAGFVWLLILVPLLAACGSDSGLEDAGYIDESGLEQQVLAYTPVPPVPTEPPTPTVVPAVASATDVPSVAVIAATPETLTPVPTSTLPTACPGDSVPAVVLEVEIGPERVDCPGGIIPNRKCLVMDGEPFYDYINGFSYQGGITWTLQVRRIEPWGEDGPPPDEPFYAYYLLNVLERQPPP